MSPTSRLPGTDFSGAQRTALALQNLTGVTITDAPPAASTHFIVIEPGSGMTTHDAAALVLNQVTDTLIENVDLSRPAPCVFDASSGISTENSSDLTVNGVDVSNRGAGLRFETGDNIVLTGNDASGAGCAQFSAALSFNDVTNIQASGTDFSGAQRTALSLLNLSGLTISDAPPAASTHFIAIEPGSGIGATAGTGIALNQADDMVIENVALMRGHLRQSRWYQRFRFRQSDGEQRRLPQLGRCPHTQHRRHRVGQLLGVRR